MISETAYSSQTKLIGQSLPIREHGIGYSNLTPDPQGARGAPWGQNSSFTKSKNFPNKSSLVCVTIQKYKFLVTIKPLNTVFKVM